jgi:branched-subunit amino acid transport protein AzlD
MRRLALWLALILLVLLAIYGFHQHKLFAQEIWEPGALRRLLIFAAAYAGVFAAFSLWEPRYFPAAVIAFVVIYTFAAVGPLAPLAVGLFLVPRLAVGRRFIKHDDMMAVLLGLSIYMFVVSIAVHARVNYPPVYLVLLLLPLPLAGWPRPSFPLVNVRPLVAVLIFVLLFYWLAALMPEVGTDALAMHLEIPSTVATLHHWPFDVRNHVWALMPMGADWCYTIVYLLGGEAAARLLNFAFLLCIVALVCRAGGLMAGTLFAATPVVLLVTGSLFVENLWALLCLAALLCCREHLYLAFIFLGAAVATKFGAISFVLPVALVALWTLPKPRTRPILTALACFLIFAATPYLTAFVKTGNPVYPFLNSATAPADARFHQPLTLHSLYDVTFHTSRFMEAQNGAAGFHYFLLLPLGVLLLRSSWRYAGLASGITFLMFTLLTFVFQPNLRYLYAGLPFAMVFIGTALGELKALDLRLYTTVLALSAVAFCLDIYFLPASGWYHKELPVNAASKRVRADYVTEHAPVRNLIAYLNQAHPGAAVAFFETNMIAGLQGAAFTNTWHTPDFNKRIMTAPSTEECSRVIQEYGARFIITPNDGVASTIVLESFLRRCTEREYSSGTFQVARVRSQCEPEHAGPPAPPGKYDDIDPRIAYSKAWERMRLAGALHGTVTYSNAPNAIFRFSFYGTEVIYTYTKAFNRGKAEISIDGVRQGFVDLYSPSIIWQSASRFVCRGPGPHTLEVKNAGEAFIDLDGIEIR